MNIIIILGCKRGMLKGENGYILNEDSHLFKRVEKGIEVYNNIDSEYKMLICSGGNGEAELMKKYLKEKGISESRIISEKRSKNTIENCKFSYMFISHWIYSEPTLQELNGHDISDIEKMYRLNITKYDWIDVTQMNLHVKIGRAHV